MAVGVLVHRSKLTMIVVVSLGKKCLVDLGTILIRSRFNLEGSWVEVLVHIKAIVPILSEVSIQIEGEFLQSEVTSINLSWDTKNRSL